MYKVGADAVVSQIADHLDGHTEGGGHLQTWVVSLLPGVIGRY